MPDHDAYMERGGMSKHNAFVQKAAQVVDGFPEEKAGFLEIKLLLAETAAQDVVNAFFDAAEDADFGYSLSLEDNLRFIKMAVAKGVESFRDYYDNEGMFREEFKGLNGVVKEEMARAFEAKELAGGYINNVFHELRKKMGDKYESLTSEQIEAESLSVIDEYVSQLGNREDVRMDLKMLVRAALFCAEKHKAPETGHDAKPKK